MPYLERENIEIRYEEMGTGNGETIFFLNGGFMQIESWKQVANPLAQDYHIVLHDMRCQGDSTCPKEVELKDHVEDIIFLMDNLNLEKGHFVGISFGGIVGQLFAIHHPDRLKTLSLIATLSELPDDSFYGVQRWIEGAETGNARKFILSWINDVYSNGYIRKNPDLLEKIVNRFEQFDPNYENFAKLLDSMSEIRKNPLTDKIKDIEIPTLVISGGKSITRESTKRVHKQIKSSIHIEVPNSGHGIVVEKPRELTTIIRGFLEEQYA